MSPRLKLSAALCLPVVLGVLLSAAFSLQVGAMSLLFTLAGVRLGVSASRNAGDGGRPQSPDPVPPKGEGRRGMSNGPGAAGALLEATMNGMREGVLVVGKFVPPAQELWFDAGGDPERARQEIRERSTELTERVGGWLREQGLEVETAVRDGEPGPAVVDEAKEWGADLIVVGSRGHTGLRRLLEGSVSHYVVDHANCPVEVVHAKDSRGEEDG